MRDVLSALQHMHDQGIVHRDIKSENVFRTDCGTWKLGDFGSALRLGDTRTLERQVSCGAGLSWVGFGLGCGRGVLVGASYRSMCFMQQAAVPSRSSSTQPHSQPPPTSVTAHHRTGAEARGDVLLCRPRVRAHLEGLPAVAADRGDQLQGGRGGEESVGGPEWGWLVGGWVGSKVFVATHAVSHAVWHAVSHAPNQPPHPQYPPPTTTS